MKKLSKNEQLKRVNKIHNNFYNYDRFDFNKPTNHKSTITCPIHGDFKQKMNKHMLGQGCPKCGVIKRVKNRQKNNHFYIDKLKTKYGGEVDFSNSVYKGYHKNIEYLCVKHNIISKKKYHRLLNDNESLCPLCKIEKLKLTHDDFLKRANNIHNNKYKYPEKYKSHKDKMKIICPIHGEFIKITNLHLSGQGCPKCSKIIQPIYNSYVYIIRLFNKKEDFIKIGITRSISKKRFSEIIKGTDFSYKILSFRFHKESLKKEQELHEKMRKFLYIPQQQLFSGNTECFTLESFDYLKKNYKINIHKNVHH